MSGRTFYSVSGKALEQAAQRSCSCPNTGEGAPEQPGLSGNASLTVAGVLVLNDL